MPKSSGFYKIFISLILFLSSIVTRSQVSQVASMNGYSVQKAVSLTTVRTEEIFTYTISFTFPGNITSLTDQIPNALVIDALIHPADYSNNIPNFVQNGNAITLTFPSGINGSISGSFQVNVHFPATEGCHNKTVSNAIKLTGPNNSFTIGTEGVSTTCIVNNPWHIQKYPTALPYIGPSCPYGTINDTVDYTIKIVKNWGTIVGSQQLSNIVLTDLLDPGASIVPNSYINVTNMPGTMTGNVINLGTGFVLNPANHVPYMARFRVAYPAIPVGNCVENKIELKGRTFCNEDLFYRDTIRVKKLENFTPTGTLVKWSVQQGNLPGCTATYFIRVTNTGFTALPSYTLQDIFPACLGTPTIGTFPTGCVVTPVAGGYNIAGTSIPNHLGTHTYSFPYVIGSGCGPSYTNTVNGTGGSLAGMSASATVHLLPPEARPCILKTICGSNQTTPGTTVRFRLRVQNIGGVPLINGVINDNLDMGNLEYVQGSEMYYRTLNAAYLPCSPTINNTTIFPWNVSTSNSSSSTSLSWQFDSIPVVCASIGNPVCGSAYNLPAYYIEFSAMVRDTAGIGNIRNTATVTATGVGTPANSTVTFVTNGNINYNAEKQVSADYGGTYSNAVGAASGGTVYYKLRSVNSGIGIINPVLVDLLPRDNGGSDNFILHAASRGSSFDIRYNSFISSTHNFSGQFFSPTVGMTTLPELGITVNPNNSPTWAPTPFLGAANLRTPLIESLGTVTPLEYIFAANISSEARLGERACNTYAMRGRAKYLTNYLLDYRLLVPIESNPACVGIESVSPCCNPYDFEVPDFICLGFNAQFCAIDSCTRPENVYSWDFGDGSPVLTGACVNHAYTQAGSYTIKVSWTNGCDGGTKTFPVKVERCPCEIRVRYKITTDGLSIVADGSMTSSAQPIAVYLWNFGDGSYDTGQIATHTYTNYGTYPVTLTVYSIGSRGEICDCYDKCGREIRIDDRSHGYNCPGDDGPEPPQWKSSQLLNDLKISMNAIPNPFHDKISVSFNGKGKTQPYDKSGYVIEFMNTNSVVLQSVKLQNLDKPVEFKTSAYPSGIYFIVLKNSSGQIQNNKVVKLK